MPEEHDDLVLVELRVAIARLEEKVSALARDVERLADELSRRDASVREWLRPLLLPVASAIVISVMTSTFALRTMTTAPHEAPRPDPRPSPRQDYRPPPAPARQDLEGSEWPGPGYEYPPPVQGPPPLDWSGPEGYRGSRPTDR